jgi:hypothetical protein
MNSKSSLSEETEKASKKEIKMNMNKSNLKLVVRKEISQEQIKINLMRSQLDNKKNRIKMSLMNSQLEVPETNIIIN